MNARAWSRYVHTGEIAMSSPRMFLDDSQLCFSEANNRWSSNFSFLPKEVFTIISPRMVFFSLGWIRRFLFINIFFSNLLVNSYFASENGAWCRDVLHLGFGLSTGDPLLQEKVAWWRARMGIRALVLCWSRGRKLWAHTPVLKKPEFPDIS